MSMQTIGEHDVDGRLVQPTDYSDGLTKQSFKDETDINKILHRAQKAGTLSHLEKYEGTYSDFAGYDFLDAQIQLTRGREIFDDLPSEVRNEFNQSPAAFFAYVNDPANVATLAEKLPALAAPGRQNIDVSGKSAPEQAVGAKPAATQASQPNPQEAVTEPVTTSEPPSDPPAS